MFTDRRDAGRQLSDRLQHLRAPQTVVLGLPRGGVPVAFEVAAALHAPLDVIVVRKLGVPFQPELAMGAIGEGAVEVVNDHVVRIAHVSEVELAAVRERERVELARRSRLFRGGHPRLSLEGRTALLVDDGIATGSTAMAACRVARAAGAARVVLASPVAPPSTAERFRAVVDEFVCVDTPADFYAIGQFYRDFRPVPDSEVIEVLDRARSSFGDVARSPAPEPATETEVRIEVGGVELSGHLALPSGATEVVLFAHGSGSSRHSPRNRYVASVLQEAGLGTLLFDLLTPGEEADRALVFDVDLLKRLSAVARTRPARAPIAACGPWPCCRRWRRRRCSSSAAATRWSWN
jgi:putative phosphoribosyl transferase